jgi:hypothetical protein
LFNEAREVGFGFVDVDGVHGGGRAGLSWFSLVANGGIVDGMGWMRVVAVAGDEGEYRV